MSTLSISSFSRCQMCGEPVYAPGTRGLCTRCLVATTTSGEFETQPATAPDGQIDYLRYGATVGAKGRFLLLDRLGRGGMGEVWRAIDKELSESNQFQLVALKFLTESIRHHPRALEAIKSEVKRSRDLSHQNVVRIYELHYTDEGAPFIAMEFVEGKSLSQILNEVPEGVLSWRDTAKLTTQLAGALVYAHDTVRIVHRDIKPANLLLDDSGCLKLSDFGIAQSLRTYAADSQVISRAFTLHFASPQQILGEPPSPSDDMYSVGATLYALLTGTPPYSGDNKEQILAKILQKRLESIPHRLEALGRRNEVPGKLLTLVHSCLDGDPKCRPKAHELPHLLPPAVQEMMTPAAVPAAKGWEETGPVTRPRRPKFFVSLVVRLSWTLLAVALASLGITGWLNDWRGIRSTIKLAMGTTTPPDTAPTPGPVEPEPVVEPPTPTDVGLTSSPAPPVAPKVTGRLQVAIEAARTAGAAPVYRCQLIDPQGRTNATQDILDSRRRSFEFEVAPNVYTVRVLQRPLQRGAKDWIIELPVEVRANQLTNIVVPFIWGGLEITSEPPGAQVSWPPTEFAKSSGTTPLTENFRFGKIRFQVKADGYVPIETDYFFDPAQSTKLHFALRQVMSAVPGRDWTNSLGMTFRWLPAINAWLCTRETRVGDFRKYAQNRPAQAPDPGIGMFSLTVGGWKQEAKSWENPGDGFQQTDDHPVVGVNLDDATWFCTWLTKKELDAELLTGQQFYYVLFREHWQKTVGQFLFPWGNEPQKLVGNYSGREAADAAWPAMWPVIRWHQDTFARTAPVASTPSALAGFYDLGGNAAEWCAEGLLCGGSWFDGESEGLAGDPAPLERLRSLFFVQPQNPSERTSRSGFRLVLYPEKQP